MKHAMRFDKNNALKVLIHNPQNEVGVKAALLEKANALSAAQVAQQIKLFARHALPAAPEPSGIVLLLLGFGIMDLERRLRVRCAARKALK